MSRFDDDEYRDGWLEAHTRRLLAAQIRAMRGDETQEEFGKSIGVTQSMVARYENPNYGRMTVNTLLEIAQKRRLGVLIRFVPFRRVVDEANSMRPEDLSPPPYSHSQCKAEE